MTEEQYLPTRLRQLGERNGKQAYPHKFTETSAISPLLVKYADVENNHRDKDNSVSVTGRILVARASKGLYFYDLHGDGDKIQLLLDVEEYEKVC